MKLSWKKRFGVALRQERRAHERLKWAERPTATALERVKAEADHKKAMKALHDRVNPLIVYYLKRRDAKTLGELAEVLKGTVEAFYCYQAVETINAENELAAHGVPVS